jgi:uncharacterized protein YdaU (DUF1376 family)
MSRPDIWMPLFIGDYLRDTSRLTRDQHGGYLLLIMDYWVNGPLPDDDEQLAAIAKASSAEWTRLRPRLEPFFRVETGVWRHKRIDEERGKATAQIERHERLARSGRDAQARRKRAGNTAPSVSSNTKPNANRNTEPNTGPNAEPSGEGEGEGDFSRGAVSVLDRVSTGRVAATRDAAVLQ